MAETKTSAKAPVIETQPHGGALQRGNPGNRGGPGRPPKTLRNLCHKRFVKHLPKVDRMLKQEKLKNADLLQAMQLFARYGADQSVPVADVRRALMDQAELVRSFEHLTPELLLQRIKPAWMKL